jgi:hypothetical protein
MVPKSDLVVVGVTIGKVMKVWPTTEVVAAQRSASSLIGAIVVEMSRETVYVLVVDLSRRRFCEFSAR